MSEITDRQDISLSAHSHASASMSADGTIEYYIETVYPDESIRRIQSKQSADEEAA